MYIFPIPYSLMNIPYSLMNIPYSLMNIPLWIFPYEYSLMNIPYSLMNIPGAALDISLRPRACRGCPRCSLSRLHRSQIQRTSKAQAMFQRPWAL